MEFVSIIMGSKSDYEIVKHCKDTLDNFGVKNEILIGSAHRSSDRVKTYIKQAEAKGAKVFIAAAGMAAHLAGALASQSTKPVIGIPLKGGVSDGLDALLSTVQMPWGMPVGCVSVGKAGAINAAYLAMQILAINNSELDAKLKEDRLNQAQKVADDSKDIEVIL